MKSSSKGASPEPSAALGDTSAASTVSAGGTGGHSLMAAPAKSRSRLSIKLSKFSRSSSLSSTKREPQQQQPQGDPRKGSLTHHNSAIIPHTPSSASLKHGTPGGGLQMSSHSHSLQQSSAASSGKPNSAIVQPFNYSPPSAAFSDSLQTSTPVQPVINTGTYKKSAQVKRNNSYVSSMGRESPKPHPKVLAGMLCSTKNRLIFIWLWSFLTLS